MQHVKVALRVRPLIAREVENNSKTIVNILSSNLINVDTYEYEFDNVFDMETADTDIYRQSVNPLIQSYLSGLNVSIIAYGQTGSGKTFTLGLSKEFLENKIGIIHTILNEIFSNCSSDAGLSVSFIEIYQEQIRDLLSDELKDNFVIKENKNGTVQVAGLTQPTVESVTDAVRFLTAGLDRRSVGETSMNRSSSRSHAIYTLFLSEKNFLSKFQLVDLAGSERQSRTNAQGCRFKEAVKINFGLLALGNVIRQLSQIEEGSEAFIRYRDSKLTRILKDSLGGNSLTLMIACISSADDSRSETLNTLRYACRAGKIQTRAVFNRRIHQSSRSSAELHQEIQRLRRRVKQIRQRDKLCRARDLRAQELENVSKWMQIFRGDCDVSVFENMSSMIKSLDKLIRLVQQHFDLKGKNIVSIRRSISETNIDSPQRSEMQMVSSDLMNSSYKSVSEDFLVSQISKMQQEIDDLRGTCSSFKRIQRDQKQSECIRDKLAFSLQGVECHYNNLKNRLMKEQSKTKRQRLYFVKEMEKTNGQIEENNRIIAELADAKLNLDNSLKLKCTQISNYHSQLRRSSARQNLMYRNKLTRPQLDKFVADFLNKTANSDQQIFHHQYLFDQPYIERIDCIHYLICKIASLITNEGGTLRERQTQYEHLKPIVFDQTNDLKLSKIAVQTQREQHYNLSRELESIDMFDLELIEDVDTRNSIMRTILEHVCSGGCNEDCFLEAFHRK